ncbi:MAG: alpha/beta fold hydrolase [Planctomycetota bacterium]
MRPGRWVVVLLLLATAAAAEDFEELLREADSASWRRRWGAVRRMVRLAGDDAIFRVLRPALLRDPRPRVRSAVAWAAFLEPRVANATLLGLKLRKDADARVRRAAAQALVNYPDRRAVAALVEALAHERDPRTRLHIVATLRSLTPAPCLLRADTWKEWWSTHEHDPRFRPADEPPRRGEYEGVTLETRTAPAVRRTAPDGRPPPTVLVLPQFGWTTASYGPYLIPMRRYATLVLVRLPTVQALTGRSGFGSDIPLYPVARLVAALERFRRDHAIERFVVLGQGASGWIAMRYARAHFERCRALILIDTWLDRTAYAGALRRLSARGDRNQKFVARTLMGDGAPFTPATLDRLQAVGLQSGYLDRSELEIAHLYRSAREPQGFATVPPIEFKGRVRIETPTLFVYSAATPGSGHVDAPRIQRHFPASMVAPILHSRGRPFVESNPKFHSIVETFLRRYERID